MQTRTILISGAGVGGPALAYWLHRYGWQVTIVEQAPTIRDGGYAVDFRGNAIEALRRMGILDEVRALQTHMGDVTFVNARGKRLTEMPAIFLSGELEILRGDLGKILYDLTKDTTRYIFDDSITSLSETTDGINVTFEHGKPQTFDLVVGADGTHSNVRRLAFGPHAQYVKHLGYCVAIYTMPNYLKLDYTGRYFATPGTLAALYSARQNTEAKVSFYFAAPRTTPDWRDESAQKQCIRTIYQRQGWEVPKLLAGMDTARDFYFDTIDQVRMPHWSKGRVVLLGDAGYCASPLSGAGTGLAVLGAYVLAGELKRAGDDYILAFDRYEQAMRQYVKKAQGLPRLLGPLMIPRSPWLIAVRVGLLRIVEFLKLEKLIAKLARQPSDAVKLRAY